MNGLPIFTDYTYLSLLSFFHLVVSTEDLLTADGLGYESCTRSDVKILKMMTYIQKLTRTQRGWYRTSPIAVAAATWLISASSVEAVNIQSISLGNLNDGTDATVNSVTYRTQSRSINSFTTGTGNNYLRWESTGTNTTVVLRRSNNVAADTFGTVNNRQIVWGRRETEANAGIILPPQPSTTVATLNQNNIYAGTDNILTNAGNNNGSRSDVERVDFLFGSQQTAASDLGISIFERGLTDGHDGFRIAAITSVNATTGAPLTYGSVVTTYSNTGSWGTPILASNQDDYTVLRKNGTTGDFGIGSTSTTNQNIGGVLIRLTDLVSSGTTIYGYSLFASNVTTNSANLVNWNSNTNFPNTTEEINGGLDLVAGNIGVTRSRVVPFGLSPSLGILILGAAWGTQSLWKRYRIKPVICSKGDRSLN